MMSFFRSMDISASALTAARYQMDTIGDNIANASTTRTASGGPYRRKYALLQERGAEFSSVLSRAKDGFAARTRGANTIGYGVRVVGAREDQSPFKLVYDPEHPDAEADGYVRMPNVDLEREMVDMLAATRSYEANITVINNFKAMANRALQIGKG